MSEAIRARGTIEIAQQQNGKWLVRVWHPNHITIGGVVSPVRNSATFEHRHRHVALRRAERWDAKHRPAPPLQQDWQTVDSFDDDDDFDIRV